MPKKTVLAATARAMLAYVESMISPSGLSTFFDNDLGRAVLLQEILQDAVGSEDGGILVTVSLSESDYVLIKIIMDGLQADINNFL